jgi:uncharacterized protein with von Willebrand factor type A (vWA) domain
MSIAEALLDLFLRLQPSLGLSIDQYDLLLEAIAKGHGSENWPQLQRTCQRIWLKTIDPVLVNKFNREFASWQQECLELVEQFLAEIEPVVPIAPSFQAGVYPQIPPRRGQEISPPPPEPLPTPQQPAEAGEPLALRGDRAVAQIQELPIGPLDVQAFLRTISKRQTLGHRQQLDLPRTLKLVQRQGGLYSLVMQPLRYPPPDLLVLVDVNADLLPYRPVYQPFLEVLEQRHWPVQLYGFDRYPAQQLDLWETPWEAIRLECLWQQPHIHRMVMVVISDGGAVSGIYRQERAEGTRRFLQQAGQFVQQLYWLNPVPEKNWAETTAMEINEMLNGQMLPCDRQRWQNLSRALLALPIPRGKVVRAGQQGGLEND